MISEFIIKFGLYISVIIRIIAFAILLFQIIPLQVKEAGVRNGLRKLRLLLLILGIGLFIGNAIALWLLFTTKITLGGRFDTRFIQILSASFILMPSIALYLIYHLQYTPEAKEIHKRVEIAEKKEQYRKEAAKVDKQ